MDYMCRDYGLSEGVVFYLVFDLPTHVVGHLAFILVEDLELVYLFCEIGAQEG